MADEISIQASMNLSNGLLTFNQTFSSRFDQTAAGGPTPGMVTIGTVEESQSLAELSTLGWCMMKNLDDTNFIEWGFSTGVYGGRLEAGEIALFRLNPSTTMYLKADTAACKMTIYALED